jgi:cell division protein ZapA (FtsZ GTPase activity inhibitor)
LIIAALNLAHQILQLQKDTGKIVGHIAERCDALNRRLDEGLKPFASFRHYG